jgi:hypothetical protein
VSKNNNLQVDTRPRLVSIYELLAKLKPLMDGYAWAEDALVDLWKMGAPDPSPQSRPCPPGKCRLRDAGRHACLPKFGCAMEKRILLPAQFAAWWQDVARRQGLNLTVQDALDGARMAKRFGSGRWAQVSHNGHKARRGRR